jgi:glycosyltransferase involved in cell wall biosynthesis
MKLLVISHALIQKPSQVRWRQLASRYPDVHVRLLVPKRWISTWFTNTIEFKGESVRDGNFEVVPMSTTNDCIWWRYLLKGLAGQLREYHPDVIFCIHEEQILQLQQTILYRWLFAPRAYLIYFSMNAFDRIFRFQKITARGIAKFLWSTALWSLIKSGTNAAIVHCPPILEKMRMEGYRKPVLIQTQIGVDEDVFHPDPIKRETIRDALELDGFVIGFVGRLIVEKGVMDLLKACENVPEDWQLLFIGDGPCKSYIEEWAINNNFEKRLHMTGFVPVNEVARYMRSMDVFVLGTHTNKDNHYWDMFPLVVVQAMATNLPVIVANGGGLPYQVGEDSKYIFEEGDALHLRTLLERLYTEPNLRFKESQRLYKRAIRNFCIEGMNDQFYEFIKEQIFTKR